jgi:hypothetical protein
MKKLLLITLTMSLVGSLGAASIADQFDAFIVLEKGHKADWFKKKTDMKTEEMNMIEKHLAQWADLNREFIAAWARGEKLSEEHLRKAIDLHKAQKAEWKKFHENSEKSIKDTAKKHDDALDKFEKDYGFMEIQPLGKK